MPPKRASPHSGPKAAAAKPTRKRPRPDLPPLEIQQDEQIDVVASDADESGDEDNDLGDSEQYMVQTPPVSATTQSALRAMLARRGVFSPGPASAARTFSKGSDLAKPATTATTNLDTLVEAAGDAAKADSRPSKRARRTAKAK